MHPAFSFVAFTRSEPRRSVIVQARSWPTAFRDAAGKLGTARIFVFPADTTPPRDILPTHGDIEIRGRSLGVA